MIEKNSLEKGCCLWKTNISLPTEAEWEYTANGAERRIYPWGNQWQAENQHWKADAINVVRPVGSFPGGATADGIYDLAGNDWEWPRTSQGNEMILKGGFGLEKIPSQQLNSELP